VAELLVKLPIFPTTVGELKLIMVWLSVFSQIVYCEQILIAGVAFNTDFLSLLFSKFDQPFRLPCFDEMLLENVHLSASLGPLIYAPKIFIIDKNGQDREELFRLLCSFHVVPRFVHIFHLSGYAIAPADRQYLIEVLSINKFK
jgi:hypothetical protein